MDCKSDRSGIVSVGGTNTVDAEPDPEAACEPDCLLAELAMDRMVRIEPVGEPVTERSGIVTARSKASLHVHVLRNRL